MILGPCRHGSRSAGASGISSIAFRLCCALTSAHASIFLGLHQICVSSRMPSSDSATQDGRRKTDVRPRGYGTHWGYVHLDDLASASAAACADVRSDSMNFQAPPPCCRTGRWHRSCSTPKVKTRASSRSITNQDAKLKSCPASRTHREGKSRPPSPVLRSEYGARQRQRISNERYRQVELGGRVLSSRGAPACLTVVVVDVNGQSAIFRSVQCPGPRSTVHGLRVTVPPATATAAAYSSPMPMMPSSGLRRAPGAGLEGQTGGVSLPSVPCCPARPAHGPRGGEH